MLRAPFVSAPNAKETRCERIALTARSPVLPIRLDTAPRHCPSTLPGTWLQLPESLQRAREAQVNPDSADGSGSAPQKALGKRVRWTAEEVSYLRAGVKRRRRFLPSKLDIRIEL